MPEKIITAIDLGSSQISVVIATLNENKKFEIKGFAATEAKGIENGLVKDLQKASESISAAVNQANKKAEVEIDNLFVAISGQHIISKDAIGRISIANDSQPCEIDETHITSVINDAKNTVKMNSASEKLEILDWIPQVYEIDNQIGIINPIGMSGFSMKVHLKVIQAELNHIRNIRKALEMVFPKKEPRIVVGTLAAAEVVTNEDERRLGCAIIDIGEGTTDIIIYQKSFFISYVCIPKGGSLISHDLAVGLRTPPTNAEDIKIEHGNALPATVSSDKIIDVEGIGGRPAQKRALTWISQLTQTRAKEIIDTSYKVILAEFPALDMLTAGVVLTGGTALLANIQFLVEDPQGFNLPCKIAYPDCKGISGAISQLDSPRYSSLVGLLNYAVKYGKIENNVSGKSIIPGHVFQKIKDSFKKIIDI